MGDCVHGVWRQVGSATPHGGVARVFWSGGEVWCELPLDVQRPAIAPCAVVV